jgi:hypothetical protein
MDARIVSGMATKTGRKWWQETKGRWDPHLEAALASDDVGRRGLAWAIILKTGGLKGSIKAFARELRAADPDASDPYKNLLNQLNGESPVSLPVVRRVAESLDVGIHLIWSGAHPFAVNLIGEKGFLEPGEPNWDTIYAAQRVVRPSMRTIEQIRSQFPQAFPEEDVT